MTMIYSDLSKRLLKNYGYCWTQQLCILALLWPEFLFLATLNQASAAQPPTVAPEVLAAQAERVAVMQHAAKATVAVFGLDEGGGGSGVLISPDGYALTNYHVSSACGDHMRCGLNDGKIYDAVIVGVDAVGDVSLIKLVGRDDFPIAPMGDSSLCRVGQWCFSAGNPFGLAANRQPSISLGLISGTNRYQYPAGTILEYADCLQTDAAVNPGNSGGPLFNMAGEIIGINGRCSFEKRGRVNVGVGYAISINQIKSFLGMLKSGRLLDHATLGATVATDDSGRVLVSNILSSSDAYRRGLRFGDEVLRFADREVNTTNAFKNILGTLPKDIRVPLVVRRDGKELTLLVRLVGVHTSTQLVKIVEMGLDDEPKEKPPIPDPRKPNQPKPDAPPAAPSEQPAESEQLKPGNTDAQGKLLPGVADVKLVQSMLEQRTGFANYFFNRTARHEIGKQLQALGDFSQTGTIHLKGKLAGESTRFELVCSNDLQEITLGSRRTEYKGDLSDVISERRQGSLAVAVKALKELLQLGPQRIGETIYLGQLPVYGSGSVRIPDQPWNDVLETLWYDAKVRFYWDSSQQRISLIEVFGDDGVDPAELYLDRYQEFSLDGQKYLFPTLLRLQYGTEIALVADVAEVELKSKNTPAATTPNLEPGPGSESKSDQTIDPNATAPKPAGGEGESK
jgi:serine protease Do